jgi:hypothetical protein
MKKIITGAMLAFAPMLVLAQGGGAILSILGTIKNLLNVLIPILITAALVYFIWGVIRYIISADADKKEDGKRVAIQGLIGLLLILSVWGIIGIVQSSFGLGTGGTVSGTDIPGVAF